MLGVVGAARAQAITVEDPTGGVTPEAVYCPNTGGCYSSWKAAEDALRAATPDVGAFLFLDFFSENSAGYQAIYNVRNQPPSTIFPPTYQLWNGYDVTQYCPGSAIEYRCSDKNEMVENYIVSAVKPGVVTGSGWTQQVNSNPRLEGDHDEPFHFANGSYSYGLMREDMYGGSTPQVLKWDNFQFSSGQSYVRSIPIMRFTKYTCPAGMESFDTLDKSIYPLLCRRININRSITVKKPKQYASCPANANPCHPSTGDKSRSEQDFVFAGRPFVRNYHSLREFIPRTGRLGNGWSHNFSSAFVRTRSLWAPDGTLAPIVYVSSNKYVVPSLGDAAFDKQSDGTWKLTYASGDTAFYSSTGLLTAMRDVSHPSRDVSLEYDSSSRLAKIVDSSGREAVLTYSPSGLLAKILLPDQVVQYQYDESRNLISVRSSSGSERLYHYGEVGLATNGDMGLLTGISDESGARYASFGYDMHGRAVLSTLHAGSGQNVDTTRISYTASNTAQVLTNGGATRTYVYNSDANRKPLTISDPSGSTSFTYDSYGRTLTRTGPNGIQDRYTYTNGKLTSVASAFGTTDKRTAETVWHPTLALPAQQRKLNAAGQVVSQTDLTYSATGQLLTTIATDPGTTATRTTTRAYCEQSDVDVGACPRVGLLKSVDGPRTDVSDATAYTYYGTIGAACSSTLSGCGYRPGDLWKVTNALGRVTEVLAYDATGRPLAVKDSNGVITETLYYPRGWVATVTVNGVTSVDDRITSYEYWPTGLVKKITDPDGVYTSYEYDNAQRLTAIADGAGNRIEYTLDGAGNRIGEATKGAGGTLKRTLSRVYNTLGQLVTQADAQANPTEFTYDASGNGKTVTDALGHVTSNDYDPLNRLKRTLQDVGGIEAETKFAYDANDNLIKVTDPKGLDTTYTYNGFGDQVQLSSPDTGITSFTYDSAGNRASQTDARGITTTYQYDALNRLTQVGYPTTSLNVSYTYDVTQPVCQAGETFSVGRLTLMVDGSGSTQYCHDRFGQLVRKVQTANGVALTLQYAYTKGGQLQAMTYPDGTLADYVRNMQGQVVGVGVTRPGQAREVLLHQATYHPFGPIAGWVYGNGRTMQRNVDLDYRPTSIQGGTGGLDLTYSYDAVGNLTSLASGSPPPMEYDYDALGRLTETRDAPTQAIIDQYTYDKTGNRTSYTDSLGTKAYAYPSTSHRLNSVAGENRTYDAAGNTLSIGTNRVFDYNDAGRMSQVRNGGVLAMEYAYNGRGEQVRKHLGASETQALYDEAGRWLGDYGSSGVVVQQKIWMDDMPVGMLDGGQLLYIQADHLGTPRVVIDPARNVAVWTWNSKGEVFGGTSPEQDADGEGYPLTVSMRFLGQRHDAATGLSYNYFRDYEADTGRYIESDPIGLEGGLSTYAYANSSPSQFVDPLGLNTLVWGARGVLSWMATDVAIPEPTDAALPKWVGYGILAAGAGAILWMNNDNPTDGTTPAVGSMGEVCKPAIEDAKPNDFCEQMALAEAKAGAGVPIMDGMADAPRLVAHYGPGPWIKMQHTHMCSGGRKLVIHYFSNARGQNVELKFKSP